MYFVRKRGIITFKYFFPLMFVLHVFRSLPKYIQLKVLYKQPEIAIANHLTCCNTSHNTDVDFNLWNLFKMKSVFILFVTIVAVQCQPSFQEKEASEFSLASTPRPQKYRTNLITKGQVNSFTVIVIGWSIIIYYCISLDESVTLCLCFDFSS